MFYEKYNKLCISCAIFCLSAYIFSPEKGMKVSIAEVSAKEATTTTGSTATGVSIRLSDEGKKDSKKNDKGICDADCKIKELTRLGIRSEISTALVNNCKALADDPINCIKIGAFLVKNESSGGKTCKKSNIYNCFGMSVHESYKSYNDGVIHWIGKYNKHWFRQTNPSSFYSNSPTWKPVTSYCTSEVQPNGKTLPYCPNGYKNAWIVYNSLPF